MNAPEFRNWFPLSIFICGIMSLTGSESRAQEDPLYCLHHTLKTNAGVEQRLDEYLGKVVLIVNVASECGLTPQYEALQALHDKYGGRGLVILGFPCNQFGGQEPGTAEEILQFCSTKYHVTFPLFAKLEVNGQGADALYQQLTALEVGPAEKGPIRWNFEKFLVDRRGHVVARFAPTTRPDDPALLARLEQELDVE